MDFRIYMYSYKDLKISFLLNLLILSATLHFVGAGGNTEHPLACSWSSSVSISISMATFFGILTYHAYLKVKKTKCFTFIRNSLLAKKYHTVNLEETVPVISEEEMKPTSTTIELSELIEDED